MEKLQIQQVVECNKVLFKLAQQQRLFPFSIGYKLFHIRKLFDEVEDYVFTVMDNTFDNFNIEDMSEEEKRFMNAIMSSEIELDYERISIKEFKDNDKVMLSMQDIEKMAIVLNGKEQ